VPVLVGFTGCAVQSSAFSVAPPPTLRVAALAVDVAFALERRTKREGPIEWRRGGAERPSGLARRCHVAGSVSFDSRGSSSNKWSGGADGRGRKHLGLQAEFRPR
jgi:hypothetical protein